MPTWTYADYVTMTDAATRLARLRLHIQEVSQRILEIRGRSTTISAVETDYLNSLKAEEKTLEERTSPRGRARNLLRFSRD